MLVGLQLAHGETESNETDTYLAKVFNYAKVRNVQALESLKIEIERLNNSTLTRAYSLALYLAASEKYEDQYVDKFPVDSNGIMRDLYENIELKRFTPRFLYVSGAHWAEIALKGNERAIEKILIGVVHSDGAVSELFCDYTAKLFAKKLQSTVTALSRIDVNERKGTYDCLKLIRVEGRCSLEEECPEDKNKRSKGYYRLSRKLTVSVNKRTLGDIL